MNIIIIGYGKMGRQIESLAKNRNHNVLATIDNHSEWNNSIDIIKKADVAIEFSTPETATDNILKCFNINLPVVSGTTGWHDNLKNIKKECLNKNQSLFYASNFSIGMNLFFALNTYLSRQKDVLKNYGISIEETHHKEKIDSPSGTAVNLANEIVNNLPWVKRWTNEPSDKKDILGVKSMREGNVTGIHKISLDSEYDTIKIVHKAKSRIAFADGAIKAAGWIIGKKGFFTMNDMLELSSG